MSSDSTEIRSIVDGMMLACLKSLLIASILFVHIINCQTLKTVELLEIIKSTMDRTKNPCTDFFGYACGNWEKVQDPKHSMKYADVIGSLNYYVEKTDEETLETLGERIKAQNMHENEIYRKLRIFYETCKQPNASSEYPVEDALNILSEDESLKILADILNDERAVKIPVDWNRYEVLGKLHRYNARNFLVKERVELVNATAGIIRLSMPKKLRSSCEYRRMCGDDDDDDDDGRSPHFVRANLMYNKIRMLVKQMQGKNIEKVMTLRQLKLHTPFFDWTSYFNALLQFPIDETIQIRVNNLQFLRAIDQHFSLESPETVATLMAVIFEDHLERSLQIVNSNESHNCLIYMRNNLKLAMNYIYEIEHYRRLRRSKDASIKRIFRILQAKFFHIILKHAYHLTAEQMEYLKEKITRMRLNIGNVVKNVDDQFYFDYYANFRPQAGSFIYNILQVIQHCIRVEHDILQWHYQQPFPPQFELTVFKGESPSFVSDTNTMTIPFGYLREPYFHEDYDELFLFAEMGNSVGHEIIHGFDTDGILRDQYGNLNELLGKTIHNDAHFMKLRACLQQEPTRQLDEKIADFAGFRLAYESYFDAQHCKAFGMDNELTDKQLFFIKFAQFFCAKQHVHYDRSHDTPYQRVPLIVKNNLEFYGAFNCPRNASRVICNLW